MFSSLRLENNIKHTGIWEIIPSINTSAYSLNCVWALFPGSSLCFTWSKRSPPRLKNSIPSELITSNSKTWFNLRGNNNYIIIKQF
jgi:hypothetical protein